MKTKTTLITVLVTALVCIVLNGVFHTLVMGKFFDDAFSEFGDRINKMADSNPAWQIITELIWVSVLFYLLTYRANGRLSSRHAIVGGMLMNTAISGTWNFINASLFRVFPKKIILPDMTFHILLVGTVSGFLIALLYNKLEKK